jgi:hypothetical protein
MGYGQANAGPYNYDPTQAPSFPAYGYGNGSPDPSNANGYSDQSAMAGNFSPGFNGGYIAPFSNGPAAGAPSSGFNTSGDASGYPATATPMLAMVPNNGMGMLDPNSGMTSGSGSVADDSAAATDSNGAADSGYRIQRPNTLAYNPVSSAGYGVPASMASSNESEAAGNNSTPSFKDPNYLLPNRNGWLNTYFQHQNPAYNYFLQHRSTALWMALAHSSASPSNADNTQLMAQDRESEAPPTVPTDKSP